VVAVDAVGLVCTGKPVEVGDADTVGVEVLVDIVGVVDAVGLVCTGKVVEVGDADTVGAGGLEEVAGAVDATALILKELLSPSMRT
jgi:hypothetical protein